FLITERRRTPLRERPEFLGWVLDDANDDDTRAVLAELPPPGRMVYRYVIGPRYRAGHPRTRATSEQLDDASEDRDERPMAGGAQGPARLSRAMSERRVRAVRSSVGGGRRDSRGWRRRTV